MIPPQQSPKLSMATGRRVIMNTGALAVGSFWRIGAAFLVQVLIARKLGVAALGAYAVTLAWINVAQIIIEAGLPTLIVLEVSGRPQLRRAWFWRALTLQLTLSLLVWATLAALALLGQRLGAPAQYRALLLVGSATLPLYAIFSAVASIFEASERMERIFAAEALSNVVLLVGVGLALWLGQGVVAVLWVTVLAQSAALGLALLLLWRGRSFAAPQRSVALPWRATLRRAAPFFGLSLTDVLQQRSDLLLLSLFATPLVIGAYSAANSIVRVGIKLVNAYWRALYPTLARLNDSAPAAFARLDGLALRFGAALALPAAALGTLVSGGLVSLLFGEGYGATALPLALLLWSAPLYLWEQRAVVLLAVARRPRSALVVALSQLAALLLCLPPLTMAWGAAGAALAGVFSGLVGALCGVWMMARAKLPLRLESVLRPTFAAVAAALAAAAAAALLPIAWPLQMAAGIVAYMAAGWLLSAFTLSDWTLMRQAMRAPRTNS